MEKLGLNFGLLIAYLIPGFLAIYGVMDFAPSLKLLFGGSAAVPTASALVPLILLALATGVIINAVTWSTVRPLIALTGVKKPKNLDYTKLEKDDIEVYNVIVESNFRYYQFYSNMLVAMVILAPNWLISPIKQYLLRDITFFVVVFILFFAARDSLQRAYARMTALTLKGDKND